jgi:integrase
VVLPKTTVRALLCHRRKQLEKRVAAGPAYSDHGLIFAIPLGNPPDYRGLIQSHFKRLLRLAGLPSDIRAYDLRHSAATLLLSLGEHPKIVAERLGHSSVALTLDSYSHVLPDMQERSAAKLEEMLFKSP